MLEDGTYSGYGRHFQHFADYCAAAGRSPLPASPWTVVAYVGTLAEGGRWAEGSLQPILSAINRVHRDSGLDEPAKDSHFLTAARRGMGRAQAATPGQTRDTRIPIPAEAIVSVVEEAEQAPDSDAVLLERAVQAQACIHRVVRPDQDHLVPSSQRGDAGTSAEP